MKKAKALSDYNILHALYVEKIKDFVTALSTNPPIEELTKKHSGIREIHQRLDSLMKSRLSS